MRYPIGPSMGTRLLARASVLLLAVGLSACLVSRRQVHDATDAFARTRAEAARVQGQPGRPGRLNVLEVVDEDGSQVLVWLR